MVFLQKKNVTKIAHGLLLFWLMGDDIYLTPGQNTKVWTYSFLPHTLSGISASHKSHSTRLSPLSCGITDNIHLKKFIPA
jgi:hypothetical protein